LEDWRLAAARGENWCGCGCGSRVFSYIGSIMFHWHVGSRVSMEYLGMAPAGYRYG
jgi:hypothetical protein